MEVLCWFPYAAEPIWVWPIWECPFECPYPDEPLADVFVGNAGLNAGLELVDGGRAGREGWDAPEFEDAEL